MDRTSGMTALMAAFHLEFELSGPFYEDRR